MKQRNFSCAGRGPAARGLEKKCKEGSGRCGGNRTFATERRVVLDVDDPLAIHVVLDLQRVRAAKIKYGNEAVGSADRALQTRVVES
jgi:hypothetical protein